MVVDAAVDITDLPELVRLAESVRAAGRPRVLRKDGEDVAVLVPLTAERRPRRRLRTPSAENLKTFMSSAGGWKDVDTDKLIAGIYADRDLGSRPPVDL